MNYQLLISKKSRLCLALKAFLLLIFIGLIGCSFKVKLVGEYDCIIDTSVNSLQKKTTSFISKLSKNIGEDQSSYEKNKQFYCDVKGETTALIGRATVLEDGLKRTPLTDNFKELQKQYEDLELLHQMPLDKNVLQKAQEAFDQSFRAIVKHLIYLKWNQEQPTGN